MRIKAIASAVPETQYSSKEISSWINADLEFLEEKVGVKQRAFLGPEETGVSLAQKAVERLLKNTGVSPNSIGLLVYVTQTPDYGIPQNSSILQAAMELPSSLASFDLSLGCSGFPYALTVVKGFMAAQSITKAIIVTCDPYSKNMKRSDRSTIAVFGDAATATLVCEGGTGTIGIGDFGTDGSQKDCLIIPGGGAKKPIWSIHQEGPVLREDDNYRLHMNGRGVYNFVMSKVPASINNVLHASELAIDDIDLFAMHQGSLYMLEQLARKVGIPREKLLTNLEGYGNTVSSTIPLLLQEAMENGGPNIGKVLISGFGVGLSWGTMIIDFGQG